MSKFVDGFLFLVCATLPLYVARFKIFAIPTTFLEISILILFLIWFFEKGFRTRKWLSFLNFDEYLIPIILFVVVAIISTFLSFDQNGALGILRAYFLEPVLLFLVAHDRVKAGSGGYLFWGLVAASFWLGVLAISQKFGLVPAPEYARNEIVQGRVVGVYNSANSLALFIGPIFALVLGRVFSQLNVIKTSLLFIFSLVLFLQSIVIILTQSQAGIFAVGAVCFFVLASKIFPEKKLVKIFKLSLFLTIFLGLFLPTLSFFGLNSGSFFSDVTLKNRNYIWQGTIALILDRPLVGAGLDGFKELFGANYLLPAYSELLQYPHNLILTLWSELGLAGVFVFFLIFSKFIKKAINNKFLGLGLMSTILYFLIHGIVDVPYFKNDLSTQFFIFLGLSEFKDYNK